MVQESMDEFFAGVAEAPTMATFTGDASLMFGLFCVFLSRIESKQKTPPAKRRGFESKGRLAFAELEVLRAPG